MFPPVSEVIAPLLPPNAIVKWERWRNWTDVHMELSYIEWSIRFTVVPDAFATPPPSINPTRGVFLQIYREDEGGRELTPLTFTFHTYQLTVSAARAEELRQAVREGTVLPRYHLVGERDPAEDTDPIADPAKPFLALIEHLRAYANKNYADILAIEAAGE